MLERGREEVALHVMDAEQRDVAREGERLAVADADEQRAHESGRVGDGDGVQVIQRGSGFLDRALDDGHDAGEMRARSDLGDDSPEYAMNVLRQNHQRFLRYLVSRSLENRGRGLVAGCLDAKYSGQGYAAGSDSSLSTSERDSGEFSHGLPSASSDPPSLPM